jgi:MFS family permease
VIAVLIGAFIADRWGRRFPIFLGSLVVIGSTFGQVWALNFQMFCAFKLVLGFGISITQLGSPVLVAELAHPKERVAITNLYNTTMFIGK